MLPELFLSELAADYIMPLLEAEGFRSLSTQEQEKLLATLIEGAVVRLVAALASELSPEDQKIFKARLKTPESLESWQRFWQESLPTYETIVQKTLEAYQEELRAAFVPSRS